MPRRRPATSRGRGEKKAAHHHTHTLTRPHTCNRHRQRPVPAGHLSAYRPPASLARRLLLPVLCFRPAPRVCGPSMGVIAPQQSSGPPARRLTAAAGSGSGLPFWLKPAPAPLARAPPPPPGPRCRAPATGGGAPGCRLASTQTYFCVNPNLILRQPKPKLGVFELRLTMNSRT